MLPLPWQLPEQMNEDMICKTWKAPVKLQALPATYYVYRKISPRHLCPSVGTTVRSAPPKQLQGALAHCSVGHLEFSKQYVNDSHQRSWMIPPFLILSFSSWVKVCLLRLSSFTLCHHHHLQAPPASEHGDTENIVGSPDCNTSSSFLVGPAREVPRKSSKIRFQMYLR